MSDQKVVIVTGAGSGIGAATAGRFAKDGFKVVLNGRTESKLQQTKAHIGSGDIRIIAGDVANPDDIKNIVGKTIDFFGRLDVLVNNAAIFVGGGIHEISIEDWDKQMAINARGPFLMIKESISHLEKTKGSIINISSVSGLGGDWSAFAYNATKGALNLMTKGLALDFAPKGVRINAVAPSLTDTDMTGFVMQNDDMVAAFANRIAMGRAGKPEEVADVVAFLASKDARFVTGAILPVSGGLSASNGQPKLSE